MEPFPDAPVNPDPAPGTDPVSEPTAQGGFGNEQAQQGGFADPQSEQGQYSQEAAQGGEQPSYGQEGQQAEVPQQAEGQQF